MPVDEAAIPRQLEELRRQIKELGPSVAKSFRSTVAKLQEQTDALAEQTAYLESLKTSSVRGELFNTGDQVGDLTFRWFDTPTPLTLTLTATTGAILVTVGCGQVTLAPGDGSAIGVVTFQIDTPSGWSYPIEFVDARIYSEGDRRLGVPLIVSAPVAVNDWEPLTITAKFGIWSSSTTSLASAEFAGPYIVAQVIDQA